MKFITFHWTWQRFPSLERKIHIFKQRAFSLPDANFKAFCPLSGSLKPKTISIKIEKMLISLANVSLSFASFLSLPTQLDDFNCSQFFSSVHLVPFEAFWLSGWLNIHDFVLINMWRALSTVSTVPLTFERLKMLTSTMRVFQLTKTARVSPKGNVSSAATAQKLQFFLLYFRQVNFIIQICWTKLDITVLSMNLMTGGRDERYQHCWWQQVWLAAIKLLANL